MMKVNAGLCGPIITFLLKKKGGCFGPILWHAGVSQCWPFYLII